jgi:hypothetical protein
LEWWPVDGAGNLDDARSVAHPAGPMVSSERWSGG